MCTQHLTLVASSHVATEGVRNHARVSAWGGMVVVVHWGVKSRLGVGWGGRVGGW